MANSSTQKFKAEIAWNSLTNIITRFISIPALMILARLLTPKDFGIVGLAASFTMLAKIISNMGLSSFLIQQNEKVGEYAHATFWLNYLICVITGLLLLSLAYPISIFFNETSVMYVVMITASGYFIGPLYSVNAILMQKELRIRDTAWREMLLNITDYMGMVVLAWFGLGFWSLVLPRLALHPIALVYNYRLHSFRPRWNLEIQLWKKIWSFGKHIMGYEIIAYLSANMDYYFVAKFYNTKVLGLYKMAFDRAGLVQEPLYNMIGKDIFPLYSKFKDKMGAFRDVFLKSIKRIYFISLPLIVVQLVFAYEIVDIMLGKQWHEIVPVYRVFVVYQLLVALVNPWNKALRAIGRPDIQLKIAAIRVVATVILFFVVIKQGIFVVAVTLTIISFFAHFATIIWAIQILSFSFLEIIRGASKAIILAIIQGGIAMMVLNISSIINGGNILSMLIEAIFFVVTFFVFSRQFMPEILANMKEMLMGPLNTIRKIAITETPR